MNWNVFLYALYCLENGLSFNEAIEEIKKNKSKIDSMQFVNEEGERLPNTCYSYIRSFLEEAGIIKKYNSKESELIDSSDKLFTIIKI